jgi:hypothetical protein
MLPFSHLTLENRHLKERDCHLVLTADPSEDGDPDKKDVRRGGTGLSQGPSGRSVPGCLATTEEGHPRRKEAEDAVKAKGLGERTTGHPSLRQPSSAARATAGKGKATEMDSSDSGGSLEPAASHSGHCPEPSPLLCLHRQREPLLIPVVKSTISKGEQAALSGRQIN